MVPTIRVRPVFLPILLLVAASPAVSQGFRQTQTDDYTRYELESPGSAAFRILYDVSATTPAAPYYFNAIRAGAEEEVHGVTDLLTGRALQWQVVDAAAARAAGMQNAGSGRYIRVTLARPVPAGGQARIRIDKTYRDTASYYLEGDRLVFDRSLGIKRNSVVLPAGWELVAVNYPSQVAEEADGRIRVSFMNRGPAAVPYRVEAVKRPSRSSPRAGRGQGGGAAAGASSVETATVRNVGRVDYQFTERAFENRDITYFLQQPETHSFRLYHDYTETRPGVDRYINVVRGGSRSSNPSAMILDTGEHLEVVTLRGAEISARGVDPGTPITPDLEVVAIFFKPVAPGGSVRLRIEETYTDPGRYVLSNDELVWDRSFGRPRNTVILPAGWYLTANAIPAVIDRTEAGLVRLRYINDRPGDIQVFVKAKRR